jgi:hypothetical protein
MSDFSTVDFPEAVVGAIPKSPGVASNEVISPGPHVIDWDELQRIEPPRHRLRRRPVHRPRMTVLPEVAGAAS